MQRVPSALAVPSTKAVLDPLVPNHTVPHAESRHALPAEWAWTEPAAPEAPTAPMATFTPTAYEAGYQYPLLVWLHADACDECSLHEVMRHVSLRNFVGVAPRGVEACDEAGYGWRQSADAIDAAEDAVFDAVEAARSRFSLHPQRVFLAGSGAGGTMAMRVALRHPDRFAGVATIDGPLPTGDRPLMARLNDLRRLPLMLAASRDSFAYGEASVCRDLSLLHSAGCRVAVRQYPGDDDLTTAMLADVNRWAMEIVCG